MTNAMEIIKDINARLDHIEAMLKEMRGEAQAQPEAEAQAVEEPQEERQYNLFWNNPKGAYIVGLEMKMSDAIDEQRRHIFNPDPRPFEKLAEFFQKGAAQFGREWTEKRFLREADSRRGDEWSVAHELVDRVLKAVA